jgi:hypothetical protein
MLNYPKTLMDMDMGMDMATGMVTGMDMGTDMDMGMDTIPTIKKRNPQPKGFLKTLRKLL